MNGTVFPSMFRLNNSTATRNKSESYPVEQDYISITVFLGLVYFMGSLLNSFSLWVFCCRMPRWNSGTVLQFNLALSDAIAVPSTLMMVLYFAMGSHWPFRRFVCGLNIGLLSAHFYGSTVFLTLISVHRYVAVVHFNRGSPMKRKQFVQSLCGGVWLFLLVVTIVYAIVLPLTELRDNHIQCLTIHQKNLTEAYFIINFLLFSFGFLLPFTVSAVCYRRLASSVSRININTAQGQAIKAKSLKMIGLCLLIFGLCFLPLNVVRTIGVVVNKYYPKECSLLLRLETAYYVTWILGGMNCCLDPLIYFFGSSNFSKSLRRPLKKSQVQQDLEKSELQIASHSANREAANTVDS